MAGKTTEAGTKSDRTTPLLSVESGLLVWTPVLVARWLMS